jgi:mannosyltransferase
MNQDGPTRAISSRRDAVILLLILALAAFLRLFRLDYQSLWYDEAYTAYVTDPATVGLSYIWSSGPVAEMPPLHHTLVYLSRLLGTGEAFIRLPSVVAGILTVLVVYSIGCYCFSRRVAVLSSFAVSLSAFNVYYSQEARAYSLLMLFAIASTYFLFRATREHRRSWWVAYALLVAMGLYTHLYMAFVMLAQNSYLLWKWREKRISGIAWCSSQVLSVIPFLPWLLKHASYYWWLFRGASSASGSFGRDYWMPAPAPALLVNLLRDFFAGRPFSPDLTSTPTVSTLGPEWFRPVTSLLTGEHFALAVCLTIILLGLWRMRSQEEPTNYAVFFALSVLMPLLLMFVISLRARILATRYFGFAFPNVFILLGLGLNMIRSHKLRVLLLAGVIASNGIGLANYYFNPEYQRDPWREVARLLEESALPSDVVFVCPDPVTVAIEYYYRGSASRIGLSNPFHDDEAGAWTLLNTAMAGRTRAWLIVWVNLGLASVYSDALREHCQTVAHHDFRLIRVDLYESCVP